MAAGRGDRPDAHPRDHATWPFQKRDSAEAVANYLETLGMDGTGGPADTGRTGRVRSVFA